MRELERGADGGGSAAAARAALWARPGPVARRGRRISAAFVVTMTLVGLVSLVGPVGPAEAALDVPGPGPTVTAAPSPAPKRVTVALDGGAVLYTRAAAGVLSASDCGSGQFCLWSLANFTGNMWQFSASGSTIDLQSTAYLSYRNNRGQVAVLRSAPAGGTGLTSCIAPYSSSGYLGGWMRYSASVYLALFQAVC